MTKQGAWYHAWYHAAPRVVTVGFKCEIGTGPKMLMWWVYIGLCLAGVTAGAVPSLEAVQSLTKDALRAVLEDQNEPALTAAAAVLWANDVIGEYLVDPEFHELLTSIGLTAVALFAVQKFLRKVRGT